jgi:2-methylcitrate dehydratase
VVVEYPIGHKRRRNDGIPLLLAKYDVNLRRVFPAKQREQLEAISLDLAKVLETPVHEFVNLYVRP